MAKDHENSENPESPGQESRRKRSIILLRSGDREDQLYGFKVEAPKIFKKMNFHIKMRTIISNF